MWNGCTTAALDLSAVAAFAGLQRCRPSPLPLRLSSLRRPLPLRALLPADDTAQKKTPDRRSRRRLIDVIRLIPSLSKTYFRSPFRRALYGGISLLGGFYVAQTISLSFGALGVNDVIAAVLSVLFTEYVTRFYYTRPQVTFPVALLNNFKMGFSYGLFIDAFKLAS